MFSALPEVVKLESWSSRGFSICQRNWSVCVVIGQYHVDAWEAGVVPEKVGKVGKVGIHGVFCTSRGGKAGKVGIP